jgi:hypothetical protein
VAEARRQEQEQRDGRDKAPSTASRPKRCAIKCASTTVSEAMVNI